MQITKNRALIVIVAAVAAIAIAIAAYALGTTLGAESAYAGDSSSESAECSSCCREDKPAQKEPDCCASAEEALKEVARV